MTTSGTAEMEHRWSKSGLYIAWITIMILSMAISLAMQSVYIYSNYATASFTQFSLLSALQVVQGVLYVVTRPIIAKIADVIGRFEGFLISTVFMTVGLLMLAVAPNIKVYFVAQLFYIIGQVGLQFMQTIFAADTSSIVNRALFNVLPNLCFLFVPWTTAPITSFFLERWSWRWGIALWGVLLPAFAIPLLTILWVHKTNHTIISANSALRRRSTSSLRKRSGWTRLVEQMDVGGSAILATGLTMLFVAIPLASGEGEWRQPHIIIMLIIGVLALALFPWYETRFASYPILAMRLLQNAEIGKAFLFIFLYVVAFSIYSPYFFAWLMVVFDLSNTSATNVNVVTTVSSTVSATTAAICIKYTLSIKYYVVAGVIIHTIGLALIYHYREVGSSVKELVIAQAIDGVGAGMLTTPVQLFVQAYCSHQEVAQTTGLFLSFFSLGQVVGDAISGAIYRRHYAHQLYKLFPEKSIEWVSTIFDDYTKALEYPMGSVERTKIITAFNSTMRHLLTLPLLIYAGMFLLSLTFDNIKLDEIEDDIAVFPDAKVVDDYTRLSDDSVDVVSSCSDTEDDEENNHELR